MATIMADALDLGLIHHPEPCPLLPYSDRHSSHFRL